MSTASRAKNLPKFELAQRYVANGDTVEQACGKAGMAVGTFYKWKKSGPPDASAPNKSTGRPPALVLTPEESGALRYHALRKGSGRLAVEDFIRDPRCTSETAEVLLDTLHRAIVDRKPVSWPLCIRRELSLTAEEKGQFRSRRATLGTQFVGRRGMFYEDEDGQIWPIQPGDLYESDDMSTNEPFRFTDPEDGEQLLGRQTLNTQDVHSLLFLGGSPIGRKKDAYRVEDIADHMLAIVNAWGLPLFWRLERGPWENNFIDGFPLDKLGKPGQRWGSLNDIINIRRAWTPNQKGGLEGSFKHFQRIAAHPEGSLTIGAYAGEFEQASKHCLRAKKGRESSLNKFWDIGTFAGAHALNMQRFNGEQKERIALEGRFSPDELWADRSEKRILKPEDAWRFHPVKRSTTVNNGALLVTAPHWPRPFQFAINGVAENLFMATGHQVLIAFHPGHPEAGCAVFNADMGPRNRKAWRFGQYLLTAPFVPLAPQVDLGRREPTAKKNADAAMRSEFRAVVGPGQVSAPSISAARDGLGDSLHMARGQRPVAENPQAAGRTAESLPPRGGVQATNRLAAQTDQMADASDVLSDLEDAFN